MAANESVNSQPSDVEATVNRWLVDYYVSLALELFQRELYADFCDIRPVIDSVLARPCGDTDDLRLKILVLKFLSRINEDVSFDPEESTSPLESALILLEHINQEICIPQQDFENVCTSLKEMIVVVFMKNNEFGKAKEVLNTHFPKQMVGKKAIFMGLIRKKSTRHEVIEQSDFQRFKREMLAFCRRLCPVDTPFLLRAAKMLNEKRLTEADEEEDEEAAGPDVQEEPGPSSCPPINTGQFALRKYTISQRTRLEAAYKDLAAGLIDRTFAQLEEEVEREGQASLCLSSTPTKDTTEDSEQNGLFQRASGSPMEASPADQPPQMDAVPETQAGSRSKTPSGLNNRRLFTVARLVVEPDSQQSCTPASQDLENEVRTEEPQSPAVPSKKQLQSLLTDSEVDVPTRKRRRRADQMCSRKSRQLSSDSEEDSQESPASYKTPEQTPRKQLANDPLSESRTSTPERISDRIGRAPPITQASGRVTSTKSNQMPSDDEEDPQASVWKPRKQLPNDPPSSDPDNEVHITDSSLDISPNPHPHQQSPRTSKGPSTSKWKELFNNAKETMETWSDEETYFTSKKNSGSQNESNISNSGHRKRKWTEIETQNLKEGVRKFGEGNWNKIKSHYSFDNRSNINLKDRWRTMKKTNMA